MTIDRRVIATFSPFIPRGFHATRTLCIHCQRVGCRPDLGLGKALGVAFLDWPPTLPRGLCRAWLSVSLFACRLSHCYCIFPLGASICHDERNFFFFSCSKRWRLPSCFSTDRAWTTFSARRMLASIEMDSCIKGRALSSLPDCFFFFIKTFYFHSFTSTLSFKHSFLSKFNY